MDFYTIKVTYKVSVERIMETVPAHREHLAKYYAEGLILFSGMQLSKEGGMIVMRSPNREKVDGMIKDDPFNLEGLAEYEVVAFEARAWQPFLEDWVNA